MDLLKENAETLHSLGYMPGELLAPRRIDFSIVFPSNDARARAASMLTSMGFDFEITEEGVDPSMPEAVAHKVISPTAEAITDAEYALDESLRAFDARTDGWGFFRDTAH